MSSCIIELNDIGLVASQPEIEPVSSAGFALLHNDQIIVGDKAFNQARLYPRQINNRFWQRLNLNPLIDQYPGARHHADLAYAHLIHLHQLAGMPNEVLFAVPSQLDREQLAVLLGVAQQCPFASVGLVDASVAGIATLPVQGLVIYLDLQLHQSVLTLVEVDKKITRKDVKVVEGAGLLSLYDQWAHLITDAFIRQCRFDPLHNASSEQALYNQLVGWSQHFATGPEADLELLNESTTHRIKIDTELLLKPVATLYQMLLNKSVSFGSTDAQLVVTHRLHGLPGFNQINPQVHLLPPDAIFKSSQQYEAQIRSSGDSVSFVTHLPANTSVPEAGAPAYRISQSAKAGVKTKPLPHLLPSHLLIDDTAYPLGSKTAYIRLAADKFQCDYNARAPYLFSIEGSTKNITLIPLSSTNVRINSKPATKDQLLYNGDIISVSDHASQLVCIRVTSEDGT